MASSFFWVWKEESQGAWGCFDHDAASDTYTERAAVKKALAHVRPRRIAGFPTAFGFDRAAGRFSLAFHAEPEVTAPHEIDVPEAMGPVLSVQCDGKDITSTSSRDGTVLTVACGGADGFDHALTVDVAPL